MKRNKIKIPAEELAIQLLSHPSYPSLHAVTGVLDHFKIENIALEIPKSVDVLNQLLNTFFAVLNIEGQNEYAVIKKQKTKIKYSTYTKSYINCNYQEFLSIWNGIVVVIDNEKPIRLERSELYENKTILNVLFFCLSLGFLYSFFNSTPTIFEGIHFLLSVLGLALSVLISKQELGFSSSLTDGLCAIGGKVDCDAVLNSKGATVFELIKLSDISLIYFSGLVISWLLGINLGLSSTLLPLSSVLTIPVMLYSLYYQYSIIKNWCTMCLGIVAILFFQVLCVFTLDTSLANFKFDFKGDFLVLSSFLLAMVLWLFLKPLLKKEVLLEDLQIKYLKFKRNFDLFFTVYNQNKYLSTDINVSEITFGNIDAPVNIVLVTNPMCHYCKAAHADIENILNKYNNDVRVTIRFNVMTDEKTKLPYRIASALLAIYYDISPESCKESLSQIYKEGIDREKWLEKWSHLDIAKFDEVLEYEQKWCHQNAINFTPALLINGKQFPKEYDRSDLLFFIDKLSEKFIEESNVNKGQKLVKQYI
ncbi:vitamin K epoxide reductase family protein [Corallibacter sp.]|uniref:vitamin K epoxide reductase family protein n=1 Tax=Corallibacter sp. TaxID=2038084 RepID=UPI003A9080C1